MFSLRDLRFVLLSRDVDVQRAQRIIGFFILNKDLRYKRQLARLRCHSFVISNARDKSS